MLLGTLLQLLRNQNRNVLQSISPRNEVFITVPIKEKKKFYNLVSSITILKKC